MNKLFESHFHKHWHHYYATLLVIIVIFSFISIYYGKQQDNKKLQQCQQICGDFYVVHCNMTTNTVACNENIRVQHFPK